MTNEYTPRTVHDAIALLSRALTVHKYPHSYIEELTHFCGLSTQSQGFITTKQESLIQEVLFKLSQQMPVEYIVKRALFCERYFYVNRHVLIPRLDTETLVHQTLPLLIQSTPVTVIDIGTGSGAIIITLAKESENIQYITYCAIDISDNSLAVAKKNAESYGVLNAITFLKGDVIPTVENKPFIPETEKVIIVTNPPYISDENMATLPKSVKDYEPDLALREQKKFLPKLEQYIGELQSHRKRITLIIEYSYQGNMIQKTLQNPTGDLRALLLP